MKFLKFSISKTDQRIPGVRPCSKNSLYSQISLAKQVKNIEFNASANIKEIHSKVISLNGLWKRKADLNNVNENVTSKAFNDFEWSDISVPNNYGLEGELQRHYKPVWV